jgi:hypothetical protein
MQMPMTNVFTRDRDIIRHFWGAEMRYAPCDENQDPRSIRTIDTPGTSSISRRTDAATTGTSNSTTAALMRRAHDRHERHGAATDR